MTPTYTPVQEKVGGSGGAEIGSGGAARELHNALTAKIKIRFIGENPMDRLSGHKKFAKACATIAIRPRPTKGGFSASVNPCGSIYVMNKPVTLAGAHRYSHAEGALDTGFSLEPALERRRLLGASGPCRWEEAICSGADRCDQKSTVAESLNVRGVPIVTQPPSTPAQ